MIVALNFMTDLWNFILKGTIVGLPTIAFIVVTFIVGVIVGFLVKTFLKIAIVAIVILLILAYFGVWGLSFGKLQQWATQYGGLAIQEALVVIGILPLGIGFIIGLILGFVFG